MKRIAVLLMPAMLLAAAEATTPMNGPRVPETNQGQSGVHVNRHVDAHVPARDGDAKTDGQESRRRRPAQDPFRGVIQTPPPALPSAGQPLRDRRY
jgi:hypothetical protein